MIQFWRNFLMAVFICFSTFASGNVPYTGRVNLWQNSNPTAKILPLLTTSSHSLENDAVIIENLPEAIMADDEGCFCFFVGTDEFAYVNAFYYATEIKEYFDEILIRLGKSPLPQIQLDLQKLEGVAPSGSAGNGRVSITYTTGIFDPSILAHEIGHEIHFHVLGMSSVEWEERYASEDLRVNIEQAGVQEGLANLLGALFFSNSKIGFASYGEVATNVDVFVALPDQILTFKDVFETKLSSSYFTSTFPATAQGLREFLNDSRNSEILTFPEPYWSSAVLTQPLWQAAMTFGKARLIEAILERVAEFPGFTTYKSVATELLNADDAQLTEFLRPRYEARGIAP